RYRSWSTSASERARRRAVRVGPMLAACRAVPADSVEGEDSEPFGLPEAVPEAELEAPRSDELLDPGAWGRVGDDLDIEVVDEVPGASVADPLDHGGQPSTQRRAR